MSDDVEALPFGEWDVEAVAALFEQPWYRRVRSYRPASIAKLLRDLWHEGSNMGKLYAKLQIDSRDQIRDKVSAEIERGRQIATRIDLALAEMGRDKNDGRYASNTIEKPAYIVMSPAQVVALSRQAWHDYSACSAISTSHRRYKDLPIVSASGVYGPIVMTEEAFAGFSRMAPELDIRLR